MDVLFGPWDVSVYWAILAGILLILELGLPGVFFMWLGIAAGGVASALLLTDLTFQNQLLLFTTLSAVAVFVGWKWYRQSSSKNTEGALKDLETLFVGMTGQVVEPLRNGRGKVKLIDTVWLAEGPDLEVGTAIRVVAQQGTVLTVEAV